jgi:phage gp37-like protein
MFKLPVRTWVRNAAAVFSGQYGSVTVQAQDSQCSRETVYVHARKVEERLAEASSDKSRLAPNRRPRSSSSSGRSPNWRHLPSNQSSWTQSSNGSSPRLPLRWG